jgi:integrase
MTPADLVHYAGLRSKEGAGPYTINMDVSKLGTVLRYGGSSMGVVLPDVVGAARPLLNHLRLIGGGGRRERRPTEDEMRRLLAHLLEHNGPLYADATAFAAASAMRLNEICSIKKAEIDPIKRLVPALRKHPRKGKVRELVPLVMGAFEIAMRQPDSEDGRVFPSHPRTMSKYFTEACKALAIPDLQFRDLRHEGASSLFEQGYAIQEVALVTGHKKWSTLQIYTQLKPEDISRVGAPLPIQGNAPRRRKAK